MSKIFKKEQGKVYFKTHLEQRDGKSYELTIAILATESTEARTFAGVVVYQDNKWSDFQLGDYSKTWTSSVFHEEMQELITLDNSKWTERFYKGECSPG